MNYARESENQRIKSEKQTLLSARYLRTPGVLRQSPINPFEQISELRRRDRHGSVRVRLRNARTGAVRAPLTKYLAARFNAPAAICRASKNQLRPVRARMTAHGDLGKPAGAVLVVRAVPQP